MFPLACFAGAFSHAMFPTPSRILEATLFLGGFGDDGRNRAAASVTIDGDEGQVRGADHAMVAGDVVLDKNFYADFH